MKETPQQKYQRLLHEVQELTAEVEKIKVTVHSVLCPMWPGWLSPPHTVPARTRNSLSSWRRGPTFLELGNTQESTLSMAGRQAPVQRLCQ